MSGTEKYFLRNSQPNILLIKYDIMTAQSLTFRYKTKECVEKRKNFTFRRIFTPSGRYFQTVWLVLTITLRQTATCTIFTFLKWCFPLPEKPILWRYVHHQTNWSNFWCWSLERFCAYLMKILSKIVNMAIVVVCWKGIVNTNQTIWNSLPLVVGKRLKMPFRMFSYIISLNFHLSFSTKWNLI